MQYDLTRLGEYEFEDMCQALALCVLGTGVGVFGDGPDGGREAIFEGRMRYPEPGRHGVWDGYGVLQAKYRRQPTTTSADTAWFRAQVKAELDSWLDPSRNRVKRGRLPEYILFTTNVALSGDPGRGGIDMIDSLVASYRDRGLPLRGWAVWHNAQICRYLEIHRSVARTYAAFITAGDVLSALRDVIEGSGRDLGSVLAVHAVQELISQQWIRLGQAGHSDNQRLPLSAVAVDLPASPPYNAGRRPSQHVIGGTGLTWMAAATVLERGEQTRRQSIAPLADHIVLLGGPGQGKSTLSQLICQTYRGGAIGRATRPPPRAGSDPDSKPLDSGS